MKYYLSLYLLLIYFGSNNITDACHACTNLSSKQFSEIIILEKMQPIFAIPTSQHFICCSIAMQCINAVFFDDNSLSTVVLFIQHGLTELALKICW